MENSLRFDRPAQIQAVQIGDSQYLRDPYVYVLTQIQNDDVR
jgi:hypothetical protein